MNTYRTSQQVRTKFCPVPYDQDFCVFVRVILPISVFLSASNASNENDKDLFGQKRIKGTQTSDKNGFEVAS
jgi:hypothetical protein